ncbi:BET1-like protein isoform X1 [Amphibalanus amphitrite]|uniref:BET1-like protein isoform X1 n=2 Tax=Amphibalanus amphitrite TaxID=1232801 RepID=UPI001C92630F|nr:BET1-like protein isoform X1 [Amphibalanus amphitrite]
MGINNKEKAMDYENRAMTDQLSSKVSRLKSLAFDIDMDTREHNRLLDSMGGDFDSTETFLGGSAGRLSKMLSGGRGNRRVLCYTAGGLVAVFVLFYYVLSRISWGGSVPSAEAPL